MAAEMQSFVWKFLQLTDGGLDAQLDVKSVDEIIYVSLGVGLGAIEPVIPPQTTSRARRRLRRKRHRNLDKTQDANVKISQNKCPSSDQIDVSSSTELSTTPTETDSLLPVLEYTGEAEANTYNESAVQTIMDTVDAECQTVDNLQPSKQVPALLITKSLPISIPPQKIYHPAVINACKSVYNKKPCELTKEESSKMKHYLDRKRELGKPVEHDPTFLPISMRNCMHCGNLT